MPGLVMVTGGSDGEEDGDGDGDSRILSQPFAVKYPLFFTNIADIIFDKKVCL